MAGLSRKIFIYVVLIVLYVFSTNAFSHLKNLRGTQLRVVTAEVRRCHLVSVALLDYDYIHKNVYFLLVPSDNNNFSQFLWSYNRVRGSTVSTNSLSF